MLGTLEQENNGGLNDVELTEFKNQLALKKDRDERIRQAIEAWQVFNLALSRVRCSIVPQMSTMQQGNIFQVQLTGFQIVAQE